MCIPRGAGSNLGRVVGTVDGHNAIVFATLEIGNYRFTGSSGNFLDGRTNINSRSLKECRKEGADYQISDIAQSFPLFLGMIDGPEEKSDRARHSEQNMRSEMESIEN